MKAQIFAILLVVGSVRANEWWDPLGLTSGNHNQPVLAKMTPALQRSVPASVQHQLARVTPKDLLGLRSMAEHLTQHPTSRQEFVKQLSAKAPNVMFLGTAMYKIAHDQFLKSRRTLSTDSIKFLRMAAHETQNAVNEATNLFNKQDVATKRNLQAVFPFIPQLIQSSKNSVQFVAKQI